MSALKDGFCAFTLIMARMYVFGEGFVCDRLAFGSQATTS